MVCQLTVEWVQGRGERRLWATRGLPLFRGPPAVGSRHLGRVVAPMRRPLVASSCVWPGCGVSMVGGGLGLGRGVGPW